MSRTKQIQDHEITNKMKVMYKGKLYNIFLKEVIKSNWISLLEDRILFTIK